jgi:hypothetical protein
MFNAQCSMLIFNGWSGEEREDPFGFEAGVLAVVVNGDEGAFGFALLAADAGQELAGGVGLHAGDGSDVFCINDNACGKSNHGYGVFGSLKFACPSLIYKVKPDRALSYSDRLLVGKATVFLSESDSLVSGFTIVFSGFFVHL